MKLYMGLGSAWDLMFRTFLVFIFFGLIWLKFIDPYIGCAVGFPIILLLALGYLFWYWIKARNAYLLEQSTGMEQEVID